ncbi:MAG TPA: HNH endonuclease [Prosthecobacter sp.]|nr:HNH endonuclease [Prosthecobacter sp.]
MKLTSPAEKLLRILVHSIRVRHFDTAHPEHFLGYGEVLEQMELPPTARTGPSDGLTLQMNGMEDLALWLRDQNPPAPAITGLIVSHQDRDLNGNRRNAHVPGSRYFTVFRRSTEDWTWWLNEVRNSLDFDWSRVLPPSVEAPLRTMNTLERTLIEKAGYAHGWENVRESNPERVVMYSARHKAEAHITPTDTVNVWRVSFPKGPPTAELARSLPQQHTGGDTFQATDEASLGRLLRRAAELAMSLPNQAAEHYAAEIAKLDANPPSTTDVLALVKQRRGQDLFRAALMDYWGGRCAVTGITIPELLRASHAKPWAKCDTDQERLNVFNGFLLCAHLDALFDCGLMTFDDLGVAVFSTHLDVHTRRTLGMAASVHLRWLTTEHQPFLSWHRNHIFQS